MSVLACRQAPCRHGTSREVPTPHLTTMQDTMNRPEPVRLAHMTSRRWRPRMQFGLRATSGALRSLLLTIALLSSMSGLADAQAPSSQPQAQKAAPGPAQADLDLIKQLRAGGLAIVMRHAAADPDKADVRPLDFKSIKTQQPLTDAGRLAARAFGDALRAIGAPVNEVLTSRYHRGYQTAVLAGFKDARPVTELTEGSLVTSPNEQRRRASALKQLLAAPLPSGTNRLLVTHRLSMMQAFGKEWFEVKEGEASVFRIDNGAFVLIARLQLADWTRLALAAQPPQN
jgi:broad specificity phosphatase PhoE